MPHIDTLKKQAKQLMRWRRDRLWTVAQRIRNGLPRYAALTDAQILDLDFPLAEAQELVAREQGFETWTQLRATLGDGGKAETPTKEPAAPILGAAEPTLFVADIAATCAFFEQKLGFRTVFTYGEPPFYGQVGRGAARINLRQADMPVFAAGVRERDMLLSVAIGVEGLGGLYDELQARGAPIHQPLTRHPWGAQDFVVRDPDGNLIAFGHNPAPRA